MNYILSALLLITLAATAQKNNTTTNIYPIPDTLKAAQWYTELSVTGAANGFYGSAFSKGSLGLIKKGRKKSMVFSLDSISPNVQIIATGLHTSKTARQTVSWKYEWKENQQYKFLITALMDSATHSSYYTGYIFLPDQKQWKLLASFKTTDGAQYLKTPAIKVLGKKVMASMSKNISIQDAWIQRSNGSWKNLQEKNTNQAPVFSVTNHVDSTAQAGLDEVEILNSKTATTGSSENVYYSMIKEGTGELVKLTDTVSVYYKGWLLRDGTIFDQTKDKPAKFPLARLIKGWQLGLVKCRVGGKIRMIIPSGLAYSIRSRSKDIPPGSVLVFEVEVLEAKAGG